MSVKLKRGDAHPENPGLFFWGYAGKGNKPPVWVTAGRLAQLRAAQNRMVAQWQRLNPEKTKLNRHKQRAKNPDKIRAQMRAWKLKNAERWKAMKRAWEQKNPEKYRAMVARRCAKRRAITAVKRAARNAVMKAAQAMKPKRIPLTPEQRLERQRAHNRAAYWRNVDKRRIENKKWRVENASRVRIQKRAYKKQRRMTDPVFKLKELMRRRLALFLSGNGYVKEQSTFQMVGCTPEFLKVYLEARFIPGMTWENRNLWQIDHIIPLKHARDKESAIKLFHYTNLQPLWSKDNLSKGAKLPPLILTA